MVFFREKKRLDIEIFYLYRDLVWSVYEIFIGIWIK